MSRAPQLRRLTPADAKDPELLVKLLNPFLTDTGIALTGGLTFANMQAVVVAFTLTMPEAAFEPTLGGAWTASTTVSFQKDASGVVRLAGKIASGTYGASAIFTLPAGYRPFQALAFAADQDNATFTGSGRVTISTAGAVVAPTITSIQTGASIYLSLDGISFPTGTSDREPLPTPFPILLTSAALASGPQSVWVLSCQDVTNNVSIPAAYPQIAWEPAVVDGYPVVKISRLTGLTPGNRYSMRVVICSF